MTVGTARRPSGLDTTPAPSRPVAARPTRPDANAFAPARSRRRLGLSREAKWLLALVLVSLALHLPFLASTLDDIDAVNFALGVRHFDPALHQPHPPGYPVYLALGKWSTAVVEGLQPSPAPVARITRDPAAVALALWSALFGALGILAWYAVFLQLELLHPLAPADGPPAAATRRASRVAAVAAVLAASAPLIWFASARPMSDIPGLVTATLAQALLLYAWRRDEQRAGDERDALGDRAWPAGAALVAALALGVRSQVMWLTLPMLAAVVVARARRLGGRAALPVVGAYGIGVGAWAIPLVMATGGWQRYLGALGSQGAEDFAGVDMLWTHFGVRRLLVGLGQTFILPWVSVPLALLVIALAGVGVVWMLRRARAALAVLGLLALPYAIFHTLFHETVTTRYALPLVPVVCYLAVRGMVALFAPPAWGTGPSLARGRRLAACLVPGLLVSWSLAIGVPAVTACGAEQSPIFRAVADMRSRVEAAGERPVLAMHSRLSTESRRALAWARAALPWQRRLPSPPGREWSGVMRLLREEPDARVWFLADPSRTGELRFRDLALVDPRARALVGQYRWPSGSGGLQGGARPDIMDLYEVCAPGWIAGEGWALTPETAGVAARLHAGPRYGPIEALVRRRAQESVVVLGGRHLGAGHAGAALVEVRIDGRLVHTVVAPVQPRAFLAVFRLPAGTLAGAGAFARLMVRAVHEDGSGGVPLAIEQFDVQDSDRVTWAYAGGWQEAEYDPSRQLAWRWMSERARVVVHAGGSRPITLRLTGESPRKYFSRPSTLRVGVGETELARIVPDEGVPRLLARVTGIRTFTLTVPVPRHLLSAASGEIWLESDQFFVPASSDTTGDRRRLSARIFELSLE